MSGFTRWVEEGWMAWILDELGKHWEIRATVDVSDETRTIVTYRIQRQDP
jgi:hypothetical protein